MGRKSKFSYAVKISAVEDYLSAERSMTQIVNELEIVKSMGSKLSG
ncbi:hypothetical protein [Crassaminicella thermophila]|nr:hypothetical protein [Crassaminicella thermophila]